MHATEQTGGAPTGMLAAEVEMSAALQGEMVECCRVMVAAAERAGVDVEPILRDFGTTRAAIEDPEQRIALGVGAGLWHRLVEASGDPDLALRAVELSPFGNFLIIDFLGANGGTIGGGMEALARYFHVVHPEMAIVVAADPPHRKVAVVSPEGGDFALAMTLTRFAHLTPGGCTPTRVTLRRAPTRDAALARRLFGPNIEWRAAENAAWLDEATWTRPLPHSNPALAKVLEQHAKSLGPAPVTTLPDRVRGVIRRLLPSGGAEIQAVAPRLGQSVRTLQRHLAQEGVAYQQLVEAERRLAAEQHLADPALTLVEVALLTGYSDETAFHRAFQRWHGTSPSRWRRGGVQRQAQLA